MILLILILKHNQDLVNQLIIKFQEFKKQIQDELKDFHKIKDYDFNNLNNQNNNNNFNNHNIIVQSFERKI